MLLLEKFAEFMSHSQYGSDRVGKNAPINGFPQSCDHCVYRAQVDFGTAPHYFGDLFTREDPTGVGNEEVEDSKRLGA